MTFFPIRIDATYSDGMTPAQFMRSINLIPFKFNLSELPNIVLMQIFQNVLLTVPFGFGVNFVAQVTAKRIFWLAAAVGLGIEAGQLIISLLLRYPYRIIDINDALLNASGILIGYGIFRVFAWLYLTATQRFGIKHWGLSAYIHNVASRTQARG
ncbi:MAG: VanZ family protein [Burkholderiales bacterium]|nr:VanZ family protein [Anaerolineae bacterium]